jgi:hypothetical protein
MKKIFSNIFILIVGSSLFVSCKKVEGEGGKGTIRGQVVIDQYSYINNIPQYLGSYVGATEDVFIVYGEEDQIFDDKISCNYDGYFEFRNLQPGKYTIFAYNEIFHPGLSITSNDDDYYTREPVIKTIEIKKKESADIGLFTLTK